MRNKPGFNIKADRKYLHVYNFGVERRVLFNAKEDYDRFEAYLYLLNAVESQRAANFFTRERRNDIFTSARGDRLVSIGAYSISSHEFRILLTPVADAGISKFMQKLQTAYTMYFNRKYPREGSLFQASYKFDVLKLHDELKHSFAFIHLSPIYVMHADAAVLPPRAKLITLAKQYRYSSIGEYESDKHVITEPKDFPKYLRAGCDPMFLAAWAGEL